MDMRDPQSNMLNLVSVAMFVPLFGCSYAKQKQTQPRAKEYLSVSFRPGCVPKFVRICSPKVLLLNRCDVNPMELLFSVYRALEKFYHETLKRKLLYEDF